MASWKIRGTTHLWLPRLRLIPSHFCQIYSILVLCWIACTSTSAYSLRSSGVLRRFPIEVIVQMVDVPSQWRKQKETYSSWRKSTMELMKSVRMVTCRAINEGDWILIRWCASPLWNWYNLFEWWRAEQSTKVIGFGFVDAQVHHGVDEICSNGGRAEIWTRGLYHAKVAIFQLIYTPKWVLSQSVHLHAHHKHCQPDIGCLWV